MTPPAVTADDEEESDDEEVELGEDKMFVTLRFSMFGDSNALADHISSFLSTTHDQMKVRRKNLEANFVVPIADQYGAWKIVKVSTTT